MIRFIYKRLRCNPLFKRECSLVVNMTNMEIVDFQYGTAFEVDFDNLGIYFYCKANNIDPRCLYFVHVHPDGCRFLSAKDIKCIKSLKVLLDTTVVFDVITFNKGKVDWSYHQDTGYNVYENFVSLLYDSSYCYKRSRHLTLTGAEKIRQKRGMEKFESLK